MRNSSYSVPAPQQRALLWSLHYISHGENNDLQWRFLHISFNASQAQKHAPHLFVLHSVLISKGFLEMNAFSTAV